MSPHCPGDNTACAKILDWTPSCNFQQFDRLCNWFANVTTWLYSSEPVLHLCIHIQHATVAQGTNRHKIEIRRSAFERLGCSKPGAACRTADAASSPKGRAARRPCSGLDFSPLHHKARSDNHGNFICICITTPITEKRIMVFSAARALG